MANQMPGDRHLNALILFFLQDGNCAIGHFSRKSDYLVWVHFLSNIENKFVNLVG
jgi:hypothetical protein